MTHNNENVQVSSLSFPDIMTKLYLTWESSDKEKKDLQHEVDKCKKYIDELTTVHTELLKNFERLQSMNTEYEKEINQLKKKLEDAEDDQKQFRKVSHILTMDRENNNYKQQIAILERRVAFYQNQCSNKKPSNEIMKIDEQSR
jgi:predicted  nucleic acid-binding Zn-ribbon protein